jgi:hypothetical protein
VDENPEVMLLGASMLLLDQLGKADSGGCGWRPLRFNMTRLDLRSAKSKRVRIVHHVGEPHVSGRSHRDQGCGRSSGYL